MIGDFFIELLNKTEDLIAYPLIAEVGVKSGRTSKRILLEKNIYLWMIDPWKPLDDYQRWDLEQCESYCRKAMKVTDFAKERRRIIRGTSKEAIKWAELEMAIFDMVILDANHNYENVKFDIENWYKRLRRGGIMIGRFYNKKEGVTKAVDEYVKNNKIELHTNEGYGWYFYNDGIK